MFQIAFYFAQKFVDWMFKQRTETVVLFVFVLVLCGAVVGLWVRQGEMEAENKIERLELRKECAADISELRAELRGCHAKNDTLTKENTLLHRRVSALESKLKR